MLLLVVDAPVVVVDPLVPLDAARDDEVALPVVVVVPVVLAPPVPESPQAEPSEATTQAPVDASPTRTREEDRRATGSSYESRRRA